MTDEITPLEENLSLSMQIVLIQSGESDYIPGIVVRAPESASSNQTEWVISKSMPDTDEAVALYRTRSKTPRPVQLKKIMDTESGLSFFSSRFTTVKYGHPLDQTEISNKQHQGLQIEMIGNIAEDVLTEARHQLDTLKEELRILNESGDPRQSRSRRDPSMQQDYYANMTRLDREIRDLEGTVTFPFQDLSLQYGPADATESAFLISDDGIVSAISNGSEWVYLDKETLIPPAELAGISVELSSYSSGLRLSLTLKENQRFSQQAYFVVAETTYGLESIGSGSVEDRLDIVTPIEVPFSNSNNSSARSVRCPVKWNKRPTTLWLRIFRGDDMDNPIIAESMDVEMHDSMTVRWQSPPSPLIELPEAEPNSPEDLVESDGPVELSGELIDIVPTGDDNLLIFQTNEAPYWQVFDLSEGAFIDMPWSTDEDTLIASQGEKMYLLSRKTKILEIWDIKTKEKLGLELLQIEEEIQSIAAPTHAPQQPILVVTSEGSYLFDPEKFEGILLPTSLSGLTYYEESSSDAPRTYLHNRVWARAARNGKEYTVAGFSSDNNGKPKLSSRIIKLSTSYDVSLANTSRYRSQNPDPYTDQSDTGVSLKATSRTQSSEVGLASGKILFFKKDSRGSSDAFAHISNPADLPKKNNYFEDLLRPDREVYFDLAKRILIVPQKNNFHYYRLNIDDIPPLPASFVFPGEEVIIPLPRGSAHHITSGNTEGTKIYDGNLHWNPKGDSSGNASISLVWYAELGSKMTKSYSIRVEKTETHPLVELSNGKSGRLQPRCNIPMNGKYFVGFAGCGNVILMRHDKVLEGWSLIDGNQLFTMSDLPGEYFGDADYAYRYSKDGSFTSIDLITGHVRSANLHKQLNLGERDEIDDIITGMSSRLPLLAIVSRNHRDSIYEISRSTLGITQPNIKQENQRSHFSSLKSNPSGSAISTSNNTIYRDGSNVFFYEGRTAGIPSASGQYKHSGNWLGVVGDQSQSIDLKNKIRNLPDGVSFKFDESGRYLLIENSDWSDKPKTISIRDIEGDLNRELAKISIERIGHQRIEVTYISESGKLVVKGDAGYTVYDLYL
ncbi:MAG: hypothetical protein ACSHX4_11785 [Opitutaceae bacterium]